MRTSDFDYDLPLEFIAQTPLEPRDSSRLLVLDRSTSRIEHTHFRQILDYLHPGDVMVLNQSRVIPARLHGRRADTGGKVEFLLLRQEAPGIWQALARPGRRLRAGEIVILASASSGSGEISPIGPPLFKGALGGFRQDVTEEALPRRIPDQEYQAEVLESGRDGLKTIRLTPEDIIDRVGQVPLPPYIHQRLDDPERYQTVYALHPGSAAAPTAGLHFTDKLLEELVTHGVELAFVTLHVGLDTFRPVQTEDPRQHEIHTEYYELGRETADVLNRARIEGRRIIAVGTTSVRVLEQVARRMADKGQHQLAACQDQAGLFILPGHKFQLVDAMVTNFHLPRSTLLMLVSAFAGRDTVLRAYQEAIEQRYRFYSFGDAMLIL